MHLNDSILNMFTNHTILKIKVFVALGDLIMLDNVLNITINSHRLVYWIHNTNALNKDLQPFDMLSSLITCNIPDEVWINYNVKIGASYLVGWKSMLKALVLLITAAARCTKRWISFYLFDPNSPTMASRLMNARKRELWMPNKVESQYQSCLRETSYCPLKALAVPNCDLSPWSFLDGKPSIYTKNKFNRLCHVERVWVVLVFNPHGTLSKLH